MRGRIGKVGMFVLALVFAVGAMGAAFASWTDTVVIEGDVNTGSLGYEVCGFSETWVYKDLATGALLMEEEPLVDPPETIMYVASANWTGQDPGMLDPCLEGANQSFNVTFDNLFPCPDFCADIIFHYTGTVPAKLSVDMVMDDWLEELWEMDEFTMTAWMQDDNGEYTVEVDLEGLQLEECDYVMIVWCIHIPQLDQFMGLTGGFTTTINMIQWNEYTAPASTGFVTDLALY